MNTTITTQSTPAAPCGNYWLCWSPRQNCFHIESEAVGLQTNRQAFARNAKVDYVPIGIFPSREAANAAAEKFRAEIEKRQIQAAALASRN